MYARVNAEAVLIDCLAQRPIWAARALETVAPQPKLNERNKIDVDLPPCANPDRKGTSCPSQALYSTPQATADLNKVKASGGVRTGCP